MSRRTHIGGYLELELTDGEFPYPDAYSLNCGRAGLELIIRHRGYRRMWVPAFVCKVVYDTLEKLNVEVVSYSLTPSLEPAHLPLLLENEGFLYVNYFGIKDDACNALSNTIGNLVLDLTQAFYYAPPLNVDSFNSARKFFGVPDGAFLFGDLVPDLELPRATSWKYCEHLLRRLDDDVSGGYAVHIANDASMGDWQPSRMSLLTERILKSIDILQAKQKRIANYQFLHEVLKTVNELTIADSNASAPLCYPLLSGNGVALKRMLIENRIFVPTYWPNIDERLADLPIETNFQSNLVCIPIDQRYGVEEMKFIIKMLFPQMIQNASCNQ